LGCGARFKWVVRMRLGASHLACGGSMDAAEYQGDVLIAELVIQATDGPHKRRNISALRMLLGALPKHIPCALAPQPAMGLLGGCCGMPPRSSLHRSSNTRWQLNRSRAPWCRVRKPGLVAVHASGVRPCSHNRPTHPCAPAVPCRCPASPLQPPV
jgi:hypothetical protein